MSYHPLGLTHMPSLNSGILAFMSRPRTASHLTDKEWEFFEQLREIPLDVMAGRELCRKLGQEIFDHFKAAAIEGSSPEGTLAYPESEAGLKAMRNIACALNVRDFDDVAIAWNGVGDDKYRWECSSQPNKSLREYNSLLLNQHPF